jgi:hypothetical protein
VAIIYSKGRNYKTKRNNQDVEISSWKEKEEKKVILSIICMFL